ncbi:MAG: DUF2281 domain-containing protein [Pseudoxanthomonas sp.]
MNARFDAIQEKLQRLPPEQVAEVVDFIDFLASRDPERTLVRNVQAASETALSAVWDNEEDAAYDRL